MTALGLSGCGSNDTLGESTGSRRDMYPDSESWESTLILSRDNRLLAVAESDRMIKYDTDNTAQLIGNVNVDFFDPAGLHVSHLTSDSASVDMRTKDLSAYGQVVLKSDSGLTLFTEELTWSESYDLISTPDTIMFTTPELDTLYGVGFESNVDLTNWKIFRPWGVTVRGIGDQK